MTNQDDITDNKEQPGKEANTAQPSIGQKGVYILPSLFTTASLFFGFYALIHATRGEFALSAFGVLMSFVLDGLDGRVARWTNTASDFGKEYDSLVDVICFGLVPALVMYFFALQYVGKIGWLVAFIYVAATALRLARFNSIKIKDNRYFHGLACPAAAILLVTLVWALYEFSFTGQWVLWLSALITLLMSVLMVTNVKYRSFKDMDPHNKMPFMMLVALVLICVFIAFEPALISFLIIFSYVLSGPVSWYMRRNKGEKNEPVFPVDD